MLLHVAACGSSLLAWPPPTHSSQPSHPSQLFPESYRPPLSFVVTRWSQVSSTCSPREDELLGCVCSNLSLDRHHPTAACLQDPFCYGAYSYVPPNGRKVYYDWLSHPGKLPAP